MKHLTRTTTTIQRAPLHEVGNGFTVIHWCAHRQFLLLLRSYRVGNAWGGRAARHPHRNEDSDEGGSPDANGDGDEGEAPPRRALDAQGRGTGDVGDRFGRRVAAGRALDIGWRRWEERPPLAWLPRPLIRDWATLGSPQRPPNRQSACAGRELHIQPILHTLCRHPTGWVFPAERLGQQQRGWRFTRGI
jgi:hypothetical protein